MWKPDDWEWMQAHVPILCVDGVLVNDGGEVLFAKRAVEPYKNFWHLPGGVVNYGESVEQAISRVMKQETGLSVRASSLIGVYSDLKRDPRGHFVTVAFLLTHFEGELTPDEKASELAYFRNMPENLGFDSKKIAEDGISLYFSLQANLHASVAQGIERLPPEQ